MAKKQIIIQDFSGGISDDIREQSTNECAIVKHFDVFSNKKRLTPQRSPEAATTIGGDATALKQYDVRKFQLGSDGALYGLGIQPGATTRTKVLKNSDPTLEVWTTPATAESGLNGSASWRDCFIEWQGAFWMFGGTTSVSKWVISSTFTDTVASVGTTITHVAQGVLAKDNNLYMFYNNKVVRVSSASAVTDAVLTLPSDGRITSACNYGNYIAIAWAKGTTLTSGGYSKVFLWDLVSSDVSEAIDWGEGQLMVIGNLEGKVVGVTDSSLSSSLGISQGSVIISAYAGGSPTILKQIKANQTATSGKFKRDVVVRGNKMYWVMCLPYGTSTATATTHHIGIWALGKQDANSGYVLSLDYIIDSVLETSNWVIQSFGNAGLYWWINHSVDGSVVKTNDQTTYSTTSFIETQKYNCGDINKTKRLVGVAVSTAPTPASSTVTVSYKTNSESSFVTIGTITATNTVSKEFVNIVSTGKNLPEFNEIQFKVESSGGAEITGLKFVYDDSPINLLTIK